MVEEQRLNISINDGDAFFAHETSINVNPMQVILDFKSVTPRIDLRSPKPSLSIKHNVIMLEPYHAKKMLEMFADSIKRYEKEFGKIEKPKAVEQMEKKQKSRKKESVKEPVITAKAPSYFG